MSLPSELEAAPSHAIDRVEWIGVIPDDFDWKCSRLLLPVGMALALILIPLSGAAMSLGFLPSWPFTASFAAIGIALGVLATALVSMARKWHANFHRCSECRIQSIEAAWFASENDTARRHELAFSIGIRGGRTPSSGQYQLDYKSWRGMYEKFGMVPPRAIVVAPDPEAVDKYIYQCAELSAGSQGEVEEPGRLDTAWTVRSVLVSTLFVIVFLAVLPAAVILAVTGNLSNALWTSASFTMSVIPFVGMAILAPRHLVAPGRIQRRRLWRRHERTYEDAALILEIDREGSPKRCLVVDEQTNLYFGEASRDDDWQLFRLWLLWTRSGPPAPPILEQS
ncbi:MAG: hypothetical protein EA376_06505 [Phycisphaeraceae bacterium]|nr:MAG: hypothetical protein EA376_06505 [Phycisphaeraceae bacterium]